MSTIDPGKLKVVELRAELGNRGLDNKGIKAVLVERLKEALEKEFKTVLPDTSIAETSSEEVNSSQENFDNDDTLVDIKNVKKEIASPQKPVEKVLSKIPAECSPKLVKIKTEENDTSPQHVTPMESQNENSTEPQAMEEDKPVVEVTKPPADVAQDKPTEEQPKGEKRRRTGGSPQRNQRRRSRSPAAVIKEDEPEIDSNKVSLSWYDSDLNLQIDKQTFLSAKPLIDGAFGYASAGARTTHGIKNGKAYYEVKITEELKWEDIITQFDRRREQRVADRRDRHRIDRRGRGADKGAANNTKEETKVKSDGNKESTNEGNPPENQIDGTTEESSKENAIDKNDTEATIKTEAVADTVGESEIPKEPETKENGTDIKSEEKDEKTDVKSEVKTEQMEVDAPPSVPIPTHHFRCGWSVSGTSLQLGETKNSYGFCSNGKFAHNNELIDYGTSFAVGDVVGNYLSIDGEKVEFTFTINGVSQGLAISIPRSELPEDSAVFPHVLSRNYAIELNLGSQNEPWFASPAELSSYIYIEAVDDKFQGPTKPALRSECEVIMMCGLPSSGKSHWVKEILKENPDKTYMIIGTRYLLERMTINGKSLKELYKHRWSIMLDRLMKCTNALVDKAATRRRNVIIDQTNVFPSAQRRKMRLFEGFKRRAVIVVLNDEEQAKRSAQQEAEEGKDVPESTLLEMKANMSLPKTGDWLEEVRYVELGEEEAKTVVEKYNAEGKAAGFSGFSRSRDNRGPNRWNRNNYRRDNYRDRPYQNNRFRPPFDDRRSGPANWNRDRRGPPRDDRNSRQGHYDRSFNRDRNWSGNFRNSRPPGGRNQNSNWQNAWQGAPQSWDGQGGSHNWGQGSWGGQNQWKNSYGQGGYNQGGYGNWNYYGQYANNWSGNK